MWQEILLNCMMGHRLVQQSLFRDSLPPEEILSLGLSLGSWKLVHVCRHWAIKKRGELRQIVMVLKSSPSMVKNKRELKQYHTLFKFYPKMSC